MQTKHLDAPFELKALDENGSFSGYGSVYNVEDSYREVVVPGAFKNTLKEWAKKGRLPSLLWQHDQRQPIGVYTAMREDDKGLYVEGQLLRNDVHRAREAYALMKANALSGLSIGFMTRDDSYDEKTGIRNLKEIDLWEVSIVTFPANSEALIGAVKAALKAGAAPTEREFEEFLRDAGFSARQAKAIIADGYKAIVQRDAGNDGLDAVSGLLTKLESLKHRSV